MGTILRGRECGQKKGTAGLNPVVSSCVHFEVIRTFGRIGNRLLSSASMTFVQPSIMFLLLFVCLFVCLLACLITLIAC